jgi:hypothetical protein
LVLAISAGFSIWGIILAVLLDTLGFWVAIIYFALRSYLPSFMLEQCDTLVLYQFVIPVCIAFAVGRLITLLVAKFNPEWSKKSVIALVGLAIVSSAVALKVEYDQRKALEEEAAKPGKVEKLKAVALQQLSDSCKSLAVSLEKNPDEYCK